MKKHLRWGAAFGAVAACAACAPAPVFAEGAADASILIPKGAEAIPALIAFLIIWAVLAKFAWPKILGMMDERSKHIEDSLNEADAAKAQALEKRKEAEQVVADARREASDIVLEARHDAEAERARIIQAAHDEATGIIARAHENIEEERRAVYASSSATIANLAVQVATKIIGEKLSDAEQRDLVEKYVNEVGSLNG